MLQTQAGSWEEGTMLGQLDHVIMPGAPGSCWTIELAAKFQQQEEGYRHLHPEIVI